MTPVAPRATDTVDVVFADERQIVTDDQQQLHAY
jgi:hypothetical protein